MRKVNDKQEELKPEDIHLDNMEDIKQALASLSVQERASLLLAVSGFTPEEVTEILNIESGKSADVIHRGRKKFLSAYQTIALREELGGLDEELLLDALIKHLPDIELPLGPSPQLMQLWQGQDEVIALEQDENDSQHVPTTDCLPSMSLIPSTSIEKYPGNWSQEFEESENSSENAPKHGEVLRGVRNNLVPTEDPRIGKVLGNYRLVSQLNRGSYATVYLAENADSDNSIAIKVLNLQLASSDVEQFCTEAWKFAKLKHPNIIKILDVGVANNTPFLVMDYASKGSLRDLHPKGTRLSATTVLSYIKQIADALQFIHDRGIVHQEVKPGNFLVNEDNKILLADFGIARMVPQRYKMCSPSVWELWDTKHYIAPEQYEGKVYDASDQYALGIVACEWLTGKYPFQDSLAWVPPARPMSRSARVSPSLSFERKIADPELSPAVKKVVLKALKEDPELRFPTVLEFATALEQACLVKPPSETGVRKSQPRQTIPSGRAKRIMARGCVSIKSFARHAGVLGAIVIALFLMSFIVAVLTTVFLENILVLFINLISLHPLRVSVMGVFISVFIAVYSCNRVTERDKQLRS